MQGENYLIVPIHVEKPKHWVLGVVYNLRKLGAYKKKVISPHSFHNSPFDFDNDVFIVILDSYSLNIWESVYALKEMVKDLTGLKMIKTF